MKIIGITGSIGCGKTTLANIAQSLGYGVYYVDEATRRLYYNKDFIEVIENNFAYVVVGGKVDKRKLRNIVFGDNKELKRLEGLIHPFLKDNLKKIIRKNSGIADILFVDVAILFEMGWDKFCDLIILADVDYEIQKKRVMERDKITEEDFEKINKVQMCNQKKAGMADVIINTNQPMNWLKMEMISIIEGLSW